MKPALLFLSNPPTAMYFGFSAEIEVNCRGADVLYFHNVSQTGIEFEAA
jgi:hypothetical protein